MRSVERPARKPPGSLSPLTEPNFESRPAPTQGADKAKTRLFYLHTFEVLDQAGVAAGLDCLELGAGAARSVDGWPRGWGDPETLSRWISQSPVSIAPCRRLREQPVRGAGALPAQWSRCGCRPASRAELPGETRKSSGCYLRTFPPAPSRPRTHDIAFLDL